MEKHTDYSDIHVADLLARIEKRPKLQFRPVDASAMPLINSLLQTSSSRTCDYTIGGIYMWIKRFGYEYCVLDDTLFIKGLSETDPSLTAFSMPVGPMPLEKSVELIKDYCLFHGIKPVFAVVPEDKIEYLMALVHGDIEELDDWADYLYDARALASLTGKKYNKKRNHVNRFMLENPHYEFEPINYTLIPEVLLFHLGNTHTDKADPNMADPNMADLNMADYEKDECTHVLCHYASYPFEGAVLRDETGEICAFTCGEVIGDTLYVHIEKMNHEVAGSGETVNKLFADYMTRRHPSLRYINREEDCSDLGLRHAKESYCPAMKLRKFNLHVD